MAAIRESRTVRLAFVVCSLAVVGMGLTGAAAGIDSPAVGWDVLAAGGGPAGSGNIALDATVGQAIAGPAGSGAVALSAGYWVSLATPHEIFLPLVIKGG